MLSARASLEPATTTSRVVDTRPTVLITEQELELLTAALPAQVPAKQGLFARWAAARRGARDARRTRAMQRL